MTRRLWSEAQARHARPRTQPDELATLVDLRKRVDRLKAEHPEWFKPQGKFQFVDGPWPEREERTDEP